MDSEIELLAHRILDEREVSLGSRLTVLLGDPQWDSGSLISDIIPQYWEGAHSIDPQFIYRPLYYLWLYGSRAHFQDYSRPFVSNVAMHTEGCLHELALTVKARSATVPFGPLAHRLLKENILTENLAHCLLEFNRAVVVPAKHLTAHYYSNPSRLDERTFKVRDAALAFTMMRRLSIDLFALIEGRGTKLPHHWKEFRDEWLVWAVKSNPTS